MSQHQYAPNSDDPDGKYYERLRVGDLRQNYARALPSRGEEDRLALQTVLSALSVHISIRALERAVSTVKAHLDCGTEADA